ncbi:MAG: hypothetical protein RBT71_10485 [Flavobacteriales bacterium]|jgi:hypothetical protein|nr:hypothetical protein [Flavobacteriales bacterium]
MKYIAVVSALAGLMACAPAQWAYKGMHNGVDISYRWQHRTGKPAELLLRMENTTAEDRDVSLAIDLYYQGRTVETFSADTCMRAGQTMNGKVNGFYFISARLSNEQVKSGDAQVEMTRTAVDPGSCP